MVFTSKEQNTVWFLNFFSKVKLMQSVLYIVVTKNRVGRGINIAQNLVHNAQNLLLSEQQCVKCHHFVGESFHYDLLVIDFMFDDPNRHNLHRFHLFFRYVESLQSLVKRFLLCENGNAFFIFSLGNLTEVRSLLQF